MRTTDDYLSAGQAGAQAGLTAQREFCILYTMSSNELATGISLPVESRWILDKHPALRALIEELEDLIMVVTPGDRLFDWLCPDDDDDD